MSVKQVYNTPPTQDEMEGYKAIVLWFESLITSEP